MAFVNEKPSEEDKVKSGIRELTKKYYAQDHMKFSSSSDSYTKWTIDREREIWFSYMVSIHLDDHREGYTGEDIFILHHKGQDIELDLRQINDQTTSLKLTDNPFKVKWKLEKVNNMDELEDITYQEIVDVLTEVLNAYGIGTTDDKYFIEMYKDIVVPKENFQITLLS